MPLKVWIKAKFADKALASLRKELMLFFNQQDTVLDVGCGTGDLLMKASANIQLGVGIDLDQSMIDFANKQCQTSQVSNLHFKWVDALSFQHTPFDIATSTLCLHELPCELACELLSKMAELSNRVIIADYAQANGMLSKVSIELDEMISGHYSRFRAYRKYGGIQEYAKQCGLDVTRVVSSSIDGIHIWELKK